MEMKKKIAALLIVVFGFVLLTVMGLEADRKKKSESLTGIISAMDYEIELLIDEMETERVDVLGYVQYHVGTLHGKKVVVVHAGSGKVFSAAGTTELINYYSPDRVFFTGIAGALADEEKVLDVVVGDTLIQHDYGHLNNDGFEWTGAPRGIQNKFYSDPALVDLAYRSAQEVLGEGHVFKGVIATGDQFIASEEKVKQLRKDFNALACEMEGAAVAMICTRYETPFVVIRSLSDKADGNAQESLQDMGKKAAENSSRIILRMLDHLNG